MGGAVSTGKDNNDLIDNLLNADYIRSPTVTKVFRAVDRAEYFLPDSQSNAYKDLAWKSGNLHLSAPCIYSEVMEGLQLDRGLSFLNLGSGTGYLSTMVGLILGSNGVNHGVEIHEDVIQYAIRKLEDFKRSSLAIDEFDFCEPKFIQGNCLCLSSDTRQYDRVYCGAACPPPHENYMKNLLKVGGILVLPLNDQLMQVKRTSETSWDVRSLLPVSFAGLIEPVEGAVDNVSLMEVEPLSLQAICRTAVRTILRKNIDYENPDLKIVPIVKKAPKKKRALRRLVLPLFETSDESSDEDRHARSVRNRDLGRISIEHGDIDNNNQNREVSTLIDFVLGRLRDRRSVASTQHRLGQEEQPPNESNQPSTDGEKTEPVKADRVDEQSAANNNDDGEPAFAGFTRAEIMNTEQPGVSHDDRDTIQESRATNQTFTKLVFTKGQDKMEVDVAVEIPETSGQSTKVEAVIEHPPEAEPTHENGNYECYGGDDVMNGIQEVLAGVLNEMRREREQRDDDDLNHQGGQCCDIEEEEQSGDIQEAGTSVNETEGPKSEGRTKTKREKFDSGLGDEIIEKDASISPDSSDLENVMEIDTSCSSCENENYEERPNKRGSRPHTEVRTGGKWRRVTSPSPRSDTQSSSEQSSEQTPSGTEDCHNEVESVPNEIKPVTGSYSIYMKSKIQELPLPPVLKRYLNFYREF